MSLSPIHIYIRSKYKAGEKVTFKHQNPGGTKEKLFNYVTSFKNLLILLILTIPFIGILAQPSAPTSLYIISQDQSNELYWTASAGATDYLIYRSEDSLVFSQIGTVTAPTANYTDNNLTNGKFYFYRVTANDAFGESGFSNTDASTPDDAISTYLHFGGSADYAVIYDNQALKLPFPPPLMQAFTIQCWVRLDDVTGQQIILAREDNNDTKTYYTISFLADKFAFQTPVFPAQNLETDPMVLNIEANKWYHIAVTLDDNGTSVSNDNTLSLYVDGILQDQLSGSTIFGSIEGPTAQSRLIFGAEELSVTGPTYTNYLRGSIAEVSFWNSYLDQATIQTNMNNRFRGDETGLLALWHFNDEYNGIIYDYGKLNQNALITGDVSKITSKVIAVNDFAAVSENSSNTYINVRENDTMKVLGSNVLTKIVTGSPQNGSASVVNKDSILYTPNPGYTGVDTIRYLICDTTLLGDPYRIADTAYVIIAVKCLNRSLLNWNNYTNGENPDGLTYTQEGLFTNFSLNDPYNITNSFNLDNRFQGTRSVVWQQTPGGNSEASAVTMRFNTSADQLCLNILNVDYSGSNKDSVIIDPYLNGSKVILDEGMFTVSSAVTFTGNNTFVGNSSVPVAFTDGNIEVCFLPAVDSVILTYGNSYNPVGNNQSIGIGNFNWCEVPNHAPHFVDELNSELSFVYDTCLEDSSNVFLLRLLDTDNDQLTISEAVPQFGLTSGIPSTDSSFTYKANTDYYGYDTIKVIVHDDRTPSLSDTLLLYLTINQINDAPSFTAGSNQAVDEDAGAQTVSNWATGISKGPANESSQTLVFTVTNNNNNLFSAQPSIDASGNLTYTPTTDSTGTATVDVVLKDNGGTANGGVDSTVHHTFTITVNGINDAPSFTAGGNQTVDEDAGAQTIPAWATGISSGPGENSQTLTFNLTNNNNGLFLIQPAIDASGNLTYTPAIDSAGVATIEVVLKDNGGTANGGVDSTAHQIFTITVNPINDAPEDILLSNNQFDETLTIGTVIGNLSTIDRDPNDNHTYTLVSGSGDTDNNSFRIVNDQLLTNDVYSYNTQNSFSIRIRTTDDGTGNLTFDKIFSITINKVNNVPTSISITKANINENSPSGTFIGDLSTFDPDTGNTHSYSILDGYDALSFDIIGNSLFASEVFDFETKSSYTITIRTTDNYGGSYDSLFTIFINNVNEAPRFIDDMNNSVEILEFTMEAYDTLNICTLITDEDGDSTYFVNMETLNGNGILLPDFNAENCMFFAPDTSFRGTEYGILVVTDNGSPAMTDTLNLIFHITEPYINHRPVILDEFDMPVDTLYYISFANETTELCINVFDPNNDQVSITAILLESGTAEIDESDEESLCFEIIPEIDFIGQIFFRVIVEDNGFPVLHDTVIVSLWVEPKLEFSQAISPNDDGINDFLIITGIDRFPDNTLTIFNRWSDIIYSKISYDNMNDNWAGQSNTTFGSSVAPEGTYFYVLEIAGFPKLIKGFVVLKK